MIALHLLFKVPFMPVLRRVPDVCALLPLLLLLSCIRDKVV